MEQNYENRIGNLIRQTIQKTVAKYRLSGLGHVAPKVCKHLFRCPIKESPINFFMTVATECADRDSALTVRLDFMLSVCRFRLLLGLDAALLSEFNSQLQERGLKVGNAPVAIVDATVVKNSVRPRHQIEVVADDRAEGVLANPANEGRRRQGAVQHHRWFNRLVSRRRFVVGGPLAP